MRAPVHGIDHVGITVPDIEAATRFFEAAFDAQVIYDSKSLSDEREAFDRTAHGRLRCALRVAEGNFKFTLDLPGLNKKPPLSDKSCLPNARRSRCLTLGGA
jgi:catechol 2,3-dioxygenase-like lactoylglutathione lyase family enzyme